MTRRVVARVCVMLWAAFGLWGLIAGSPAQADEYIQIESHPDLASATSRAQAYAQILNNVNGYLHESGWYAITLGPYETGSAQAVLGQLLAQGTVPGDSFVDVDPVFLQRFWPVGAPLVPEDSAVPETTEAQAETLPAAPAAPPEETPAQARQSEAQLTAFEREELQIAMQWFGFYEFAIDGDFGPGTRAAMAAYQAARGFDQTSVLTTRQRAALLDEYRQELAAINMQPVIDARAGVQITLPLAMVEFDRYEFPFAQYAPVNDSGVRVLLISQPGTQATLAGLYEIMQTLEIVPLEGERSRNAQEFLLTGQSPSLRSHTVAQLRDGQIKGFTLIWPPERDQQIARVLPMMEDSLTFLPGVLDPGAISEETEQGIDLIAGLEVRRPEIIRSGFFASSNGIVITTTDVVGPQCTRVVIDEAYEAQVAYRDDALGLVVLRPQIALAPMSYARFASGRARLRSDVAVAGFPFDGALGAASLNFGTLEQHTGLDGDPRLIRLGVSIEASETGAPVLDGSGRVLGMVLPADATGRTVPDGVSFALAAGALADALSASGVIGPAPITTPDTAPMGREQLARLGADMAVLVSCWN